MDKDIELWKTIYVTLLGRPAATSHDSIENLPKVVDIHYEQIQAALEERKDKTKYGTMNMHFKE